jgi:DNA sulfur modification protein DndD
MLNTKIRLNLAKRNSDRRRISGLEMGSKVQEVLEEYSKVLRNKKLELLEGYILDALKMLLHKKDFIDKVSIDKESFKVRLYKGNDDEITKNMLSKGELQMYATAVVWALAKTSGRPLPFMIDTPLARLDVGHRDNLIEKFFPYASHQVVIFSTDSEIDEKYYPKMKPYLSRSYAMEYLPGKGKTMQHLGYFWDDNGVKQYAV